MSYRVGDRVQVDGEGEGTVIDVHSPEGLDIRFDRDGIVQGWHVASVRRVPTPDGETALDRIDAILRTNHEMWTDEEFAKYPGRFRLADIEQLRSDLATARAERPTAQEADKMLSRYAACIDKVGELTRLPEMSSAQRDHLFAVHAMEMEARADLRKALLGASPEPIRPAGEENA
ncbi:MAG TPA: hypothetical protein VGQ44_17090 [Gemmatimonadaceae bacterium]|jgi:hypothetical protein|nr:hypothetical protein [Gemmatimonadaceae bacterium]